MECTKNSSRIPYTVHQGFYCKCRTEANKLAGVHNQHPLRTNRARAAAPNPTTAFRHPRQTPGAGGLDSESHSTGDSPEGTSPTPDPFVCLSRVTMARHHDWCWSDCLLYLQSAWGVWDKRKQARYGRRRKLKLGSGGASAAGPNEASGRRDGAGRD